MKENIRIHVEDQETNLRSFNVRALLRLRKLDFKIVARAAVVETPLNLVHLHCGTDHRECSSCSQYPLCNLCTGASYTDARGESQVGRQVRGEDRWIPRCAHLAALHMRAVVSDSPTEVPFLLNNTGDLPGIMIVSQTTDLYVQPSQKTGGPALQSVPVYALPVH